MTLRNRLLGVAAGVALDAALGEVPGPHPVAGFGRVMLAVEARLWRDQRSAGVGHAAVGTGLGLLAGALAPSVAVAAWVTVAARGLDEAARRVEEALVAGDLPRARAALPSLVGRDPSALDEKEIARAVVESVAENAVDALVVPVWWGAVAGAPGAYAARAVNTLDAMVGYRSPRYRHFGWASARLDDAAAFVPARLTALAVALLCPSRAGAVLEAVRQDAPRHPSPNAGVAEAAFAGALGLRLGGPTRYATGLELRPTLGTGRPPEVCDIARARALLRRLTALTALTSLLGGLAVAPACGRSR